MLEMIKAINTVKSSPEGSNYTVNVVPEDLSIHWAHIKVLSNTVPCLESTRYIVAKMDNEEELNKCLLT